MKKTIIIELLLVIAISLLIYPWILYLQSLNLYITFNAFNERGFVDCITMVILLSLPIIANLTAIILIAIKDFPVFKPLLDKLNARKQKRAQEKAVRAEADKQAKIAALEAQLQELKKDDN